MTISTAGGKGRFGGSSAASPLGFQQTRPLSKTAPGRSILAQEFGDAVQLDLDSGCACSTQAGRKVFSPPLVGTSSGHLFPSDHRSDICQFSNCE